MKTILVPTDFSVPAFKALYYALDLAQKTKYKVLVCHVYQVALGFNGDPQLASQEFRREAQKEMDNFVADIAEPTRTAVGLETMLKDGNIVGELCRIIEEQDIALIVMGTTGGNNMLKKLFGTTTETIIKQSRCPVLAIPEGGSFAPIKNIVYASDFENCEEIPIGQILQVKELFESSLSILHVKSEVQPDLVDDEDIKNDLIKCYPDEKFNFVQIDNRDVAAGLEKYVREHQSTLLAFTILPRRWWESLFHNSITSRLIKNLKLPMLALPKTGKLLNFDNYQGSATNITKSPNNSEN